MATVRNANYYRGKPGDRVEGTPGNDRLTGTTLYGRAGNDYLFGLETNDYIHGGWGNDVLVGGVGDDFLEGHYGNDILQGGTGWDKLYGGSGNHTLSGNAGNDTLYGGAGNDVLYAGIPRYRGNGLFSPAGRDILVGGSGADTFDLTTVFSAHYSEGVFNVEPDVAIIKDFNLDEGDRLELGIRVKGARFVDYDFDFVNGDTFISANLPDGKSVEVAVVEGAKELFSA